MNEFQSTLVIALVSAAAALGGVIVGNHLNRSQLRESLRESAMNVQRDHIVAIIVACREWASLQQIMVPGMGKMSMDDLTAFVETDTGKRLATLGREMASAFTKARLFVVDDELRVLVIELSQFVENFADVVNGPILKEQATFDHVLAGLAAVGAFQRSITMLEARSVVALRSPIWAKSNHL